MSQKKYLSNNSTLMAEWDYSKNTPNGLDPTHLVEGSNKRAWWTCTTCHHEWEAQIQKRAVRGQGCPICGKRKQAQIQAKNRVADGSSLAEKRPDLMSEWDYAKNDLLQLNPLYLTSGSNKKAWWRCSVCKYEWEAQICKRTVRGQGCPICGKEKQLQTQKEQLQKRVLEEGSFADAFPELIAEWDYQNNKKTPHVSQDGLGIYRIRVKVAPVIFLGDLSVQDGMVHSDVLALFLSNLHHAIHAASALGIVEDIEVDGMTLALSLCDNAVLFLRTCSDARIVLRYTAQHVHTLADVHYVIVNLDAVDTCVFVLIRKPLALQPFVSVVCVTCH